MDLSLLEEFARYELNPTVRHWLREALKRGPDSRKLRDELTFNRFDVLLDFERGTATIVDDLDVSPDGRAEIPIAEFARLLDEQSGMST